MDPSSNFLFNHTANVLHAKDCLIAEQARKLAYQDGLLKHQQQLLAEEQAEIAALKKRVEDLRCQTATMQGRLMDKDSELDQLRAALAKQIEENQPHVNIESRETQVQTDDAHACEQKDAHTQVFFYVDYAWDKTEQFVSAALEARQALRREIRQVQSELAEVDAELEDIELLQTLLLSQSVPPPAPTEQVRPAVKQAKKRLSAAERKQIDAEKAETALKAHNEARRARKEQERREKERVRHEKQQARALSTAKRIPSPVEEDDVLPGHDDPQARALAVQRLVRDRMQEKQVKAFLKTMSECFELRSCSAYNIEFNADSCRLLQLYTEESLGMDGFDLEWCTTAGKFFQKFILYIDTQKDDLLVQMKSPPASGADILSWLDHHTFYQTVQNFFGYVSPKWDDDTCAFIGEQYDRIKDQEVLKAVQFEMLDDQDVHGLAIFKITVPGGKRIHVSMLSLVLWTISGKLAVTVESLAQPAPSEGVPLEDY